MLSALRFLKDAVQPTHPRNPTRESAVVHLSRKPRILSTNYCKTQNYKEGVLETTQEGNFTTQFYTFSKEGTVKIIKNDGSVAEYTFSFNEDTQILTIPKLNHEYKVLSVSGTDMKWQYDSWAIGGNGPIEYQSYYYLKRR